MDAAKEQQGRSGGRFTSTADPNEYLIQLEASAIRMHWTPYRERLSRGCIAEGVLPIDASSDLSRLMSDRCRR